MCYNYRQIEGQNVPKINAPGSGLDNFLPEANIIKMSWILYHGRKGFAMNIAEKTPCRSAGTGTKELLVEMSSAMVELAESEDELLRVRGFIMRLGRIEPVIFDRELVRVNDKLVRLYEEMSDYEAYVAQCKGWKPLPYGSSPDMELWYSTIGKYAVTAKLAPGDAFYLDVLDTTSGEHDVTEVESEDELHALFDSVCGTLNGEEYAA